MKEKILAYKLPMNKTARIFEDVGGYFVCDESSKFLDARGRPYGKKSDALRAASYMGYTHAIGSGTYWDGVRKIPAKYHN